MKKNILLCFCFLFYLSWGQEYLDSYDVKTNQQRLDNSYLFIIENLKTHIFFDDGHCHSYLNVLAKSRGETEKLTHSEDFSSSVSKHSYNCFRIPFVGRVCASADWYVDNKISSFHFVMKKDIEYVKANYDIVEESEWGNCGSGMETRGSWSIPIFISPIEPCKTKTIEPFFSGDSDELELTVNASYKILPIHYLESKNPNDTDNTFLPIGDKIKLSAKNDFPSSWYYFQYTTDSINGKYINWKDINSNFIVETDKNRLSISVSAEDIFNGKANALEKAGEKVYFRVVTKNGNENCSSSNIVTLNVGQSGPKIQDFKAIHPKCFTDLGSLEVEFDRTLLPKEFLKVSLVHKNTKIAFMSYDYAQTKAMLGNGKKLVFENIPAGEYIFQTIGSIEHSRETKDKSILTQYLPTYSDGDNYDKTFVIKAPPPLTAQITHKTDNLCHGEQKGTITVSVSGGTPPYKYTRNRDTITVTGNTFTLTKFPVGTHTFTISDAHNCKVLDVSGKEVVFSQVITAPSAIIILDKSKKDVSGYGLKNGQITVQISGGTPFSAGAAYKVVLKGTQGNEITTFTTSQNVGNTEVFYSQLPPDTYTLTVTDQNNCSITPKTYLIKEPPPLIVSVLEENPISCNPLNDDPNNDPTLIKNGALTAHVKGGVVPYRYQWSRVSGATVTPLLGETEASLKGLTEGTYQVHIIDKNDNETRGTFTLKFPERLLLTVQSTEISCASPHSGVTKAIVQGGTPPYSYQWSDGQTTQTASGLSAGKYFVVVSDSRGCSLQSQVVLSYPEAVRIDSEQITQVTCHKGSDGSISVHFSGGKGNVAVRWYDSNNQEITKNISADRKTIRNLSAGKYKIVLRDEGDCPAIEEEFEITQPDAISLNLPQEITLCQGDSHTFDLSGQLPSATFQWFDASGNLLGSDASFTVSQQGEYRVEATNSTGCKATANVRVRQSSQVLEVDFLVATTSYYDYTLKLINLSKNIDSFQWQFSDDVVIISQNKQDAEIRFTKEGTYIVGFQGTLGDCSKLIQKTLYVEKDRIGLSQETTFQKQIESFLVVPNPNSGSYELHIKLNKASSIRVRLVDLLGCELFAPEEFPANTDFILPFNRPTLSAGQYIILLETEGDVLSQKMIVK